LNGFPVARGLVVTNSEDGTSKARRKGWKLLPIWIDEGVGIASSVRIGGPGTLF
jgi:putative SOS response-associated peptidase YedK